MEIGRRIYYDLENGNILVDTGERSGLVSPTTSEQDRSTYQTLAERVVNSYAFIELPFRKYAQDFAKSKGFRVNLQTMDLEFAYPDPNESEGEPIYQKPLSDKISENTDYLIEVDFRLIMMELGM